MIVHAKRGREASIHHSIREIELQIQPIFIHVQVGHNGANHNYRQLHHKHSTGIDDQNRIRIHYTDSQTLCLLNVNHKIDTEFVLVYIFVTELVHRNHTVS